MADGEGPDKDQKTLDPTEKRLRDAYKKGQAPISRDLNSWVFLSGCFVVCIWILPSSFHKLANLLSEFFQFNSSFHIDHADSLKAIIKYTALGVFDALWLPFLSLMGVAIAIGLSQSFKAISAESIQFKLQRISIKSGFSRIFSAKNFVETVKSTLKLFVLGTVFVLLFKSQTSEFSVWLWATPYEFLLLLKKLATKYFIFLLIAYASIAIFDVWYQRFKFMENLKMTVQEAKDERKEQDGDPAVKARVREIQLVRSRNRMLSNVKDSTVIVTNPTHYSVALRWQEDSQEAPIVVAKGLDHLAFTIREIANRSNVPIVENAPVARSLYDSVPLDQQIPPEYYKVVADIIRTALKIRSRTFK